MAERDYGPNSERVEALLGRLPRLDWGDVAALAAARPDSADVAFVRSASVVTGTIAAAKRGDAVRAARAVATEWATRWVRASVAPVTFETAVLATLAERDRSMAELAGRALPTVLDAVSALVVADLLRPPDFEALYGPWASVVDAAPARRVHAVSGL
jgi:hypothetical protein